MRTVQGWMCGLCVILIEVFPATVTASDNRLANSAPPVTSESSFVFRDMTLVQAQAAGIANAPEMTAAHARVLELQAELAQAKGTSTPTLLANYTQTPQGNPPGPTIASRLGSAGVQFSVGDLLSASPLTRAAMLNLASAQADEAAAEATERAKVAGLYYDALSAAAVAAARDEALQLAVAQAAAAHIRFSAGDAPRLDVERADLATARAHVDCESSQNDAVNALDALRVETGRMPVPSVGPIDFSSSALATTVMDPAAATDTAKRLRPEILSAELSRQAAAAQAQAARNGAWPNLILGASYGSGTDSGVPVRGPVYSAQMSIPLTAAAHERTQIARAQCVELQAKADEAERVLLLGVAASARSFAAAVRGLVFTDAAEQVAAQAWQGALLGYREGATSEVDLDAARAAYVQAHVDALTARYNVLKLQAVLLVGVGK